MARVSAMQMDDPIVTDPESDPMPEALLAIEAARLLAESVLASSLDCVEVLSLDGRVYGINAKGAAVHGLASPADVIGRLFVDHFSISHREEILQALRAAASGTPSRTTYDRSAQVAPSSRLEVTLQAHSAAGSPVWLIATVREVAGLDPGEASGFLAQSAAQTMPHMLWMAAPSGRLEWANDRMRGAMSPHSRADDWRVVVHPDDNQRIAIAWADALRFGSRLETEARIEDAGGTARWHLATVVPLRSADGLLSGWVGTFTDINNHKAAFDALVHDNEQLEQDIFKQLHEVKRTQSRLQAYFDTCPDYLTLMLLSKDGGLTYEDLNPAATALEGRKRSAVVGRHPAEIIGTEAAGEMEGYVKRCLRTGRSISYTVQRKRGDGTAITIQVVGAPLEYSNEEEGLVLLCGRDITEQRSVEEALRQSQKMEAVGQLTGGLAHDFNNLLTGITGSLDLLQMRVAKGRLDSLDRYFAAAQSAAARAAALTHRLLAFSRRQTLDPKATSANALIAGMEDLLQRTAGPAIALDVVAAADLWTILVDPSQLENALLNLCINARDALPDGGRILIETHNTCYNAREADECDVPAGDYVVLSVTDNGVGMSSDVVKRIFDPFFTTKPIGLGTGLGLSMIYGFARQSGGQVRVRSAVGIGTTLRILLPRHHGDEERIEPLGTPSPPPRSVAGETILVIDDEPTIRMLVKEVLEDLGYTALEAEDGPAGVKLLRSRERIDLLVTDVGLPGGMNGRQVAELGRALRPALKILFITGYAESAALNQSHLGPGMQLLIKPFALETLAVRVKSLFEQPDLTPNLQQFDGGAAVPRPEREGG